MVWLAKLVQLGASKYGIALLVLFLVVQGYLFIRPHTPELDPVRAQAADAVAADIAEALGTQADSAWSSKYVKVARLDGDQGDAIRTRIEAALQTRTNCKLVVDSVFAEVRDQVAAKLARLGAIKAATADRWKGQPIQTATDALALARRRGLDYVVYGAVEDFRVLHDQSFVKVAVRVAAAAAGSVVFERRFEEGDAAVFAGVTTDALRADTTRAGWRLVGWLLFVILLPVCSASFWKGLLERESNLVNAVCLIVLTLIDGLLAWALMGFWLETIWLWLILVFGAVTATIYNLLILNILERNRERGKYAV